MKITLESGIDQTLSLVGYNFLFKSGVGDIRVKLLENDSSVIEDSILEVGEQLIGGNERFEKVVIENIHTATQEIEFEVGSFRRENTREGASVNVISSPPIEVSNFPVAEPKYFGGANLVSIVRQAIGLSTLIEPVDNVNGVVVYRASALSYSRGYACSLSYDVSAPVAWVNGHHLVASAHGSEYYYDSNTALALPLFIPQGYGLYAVSTTSSCNVSATFEVL